MIGSENQEKKRPTLTPAGFAAVPAAAAGREVGRWRLPGSAVVAEPAAARARHTADGETIYEQLENGTRGAGRRLLQAGRDHGRLE